MKKIIAVLVAAALLLSGISAFAALTPAEEGAIYRALINAGFDQPDFVVRHFDSIAALTTDELAAIDSYFAAIDDAVKVAVTNVDENLAGSQLVTIFANLNAIAKILKISYKIYLEVPTAVAIDEPSYGLTNGFSRQTDSIYVFISETEMMYIPINTIINSGLIAVVNGEYAALVADFVEANQLIDYEIAAYDLSDFALQIGIYCEENGVCIGPNGLLSTIYADLSITEVTGRDDMFAANSGVRSLFAKLQKVVKAVAAYKPAAAAPAAPAADRLPDTATSYGNLVVLGVVMMVVAAAAVIGVKKAVRS